MALSDITIYRSYPVINGYVQVPHNKPKDKTRVSLDSALTNINGSNVVSLSLGSGRQTGSKFGAQEIFLLPGVAADSWYTTNPVDEVSAVNG